MRRQAGFLGLEGAAMYLVISMAVLLAASWAGSGVAIWYLDGKVEAANGRATAAAAAQAKEEQSRKGFQAAGEACSASVELLERTAADAQTEANKRRAESQQLAAAVQGHINAMLNRPRQAGLDECQAIKRELDDEIDYRAGRPAAALWGELSGT
jgi:hypothetical protein